VAAFRMKQRGLVLHEKLDKAAVSGPVRFFASQLPWAGGWADYAMHERLDNAAVSMA